MMLEKIVFKAKGFNLLCYLELSFCYTCYNGALLRLPVLEKGVMLEAFPKTAIMILA